MWKETDKRGLKTVIVLGMCAVLWEITSRTEWLNPFLFPPPSTIFVDTVRAFADPPYASGGSLAYHLAKSAQRITLGWALGSVTGIVFGLLLEYRRWFAGGVGNAMLEFARPVPVILALPILVISFGLGDLPRILVIAWGSFIFVAINTVYGVRTARAHLLPDVVRSFGGSQSVVVQKAVVGLALPQILAGLRQAVAISIVLMVASELILSTNGLGWYIGYTWRILFPSLMYGGIILVGLIGLVASALFSMFERVALRGYEVRSR